MNKGSQSGGVEHGARDGVGAELKQEEQTK